ncbi:L-seryl-tRNA(Sec) selenium transferase [Halomonas shantousis]
MNEKTQADSRRRLPAVDTLLAHPALQQSLAQHGRRLVVRAIRETLVAERSRLGNMNDNEGEEPASEEALAERCLVTLSVLTRPRARAVFNLTGTVIHTNLGRAPLAEAAIEALTRAARYPIALEYDLASGRRGDRDSLVEELLCELTGAEAATVVNNNAAAVVLTLGALGAGREAIISRGELIEIGGAFRMPDIMTAAGCRLREVGATNRTHTHDYRDALNSETGLIVKAHTSNYAITGFTKSVAESELARIAHEHDVPLVIDLGSGALINLSALGLPHESLPSEAIADGADVVTFSGDKLLGGPQAGIIVGKRECIERIKRHPLKRALRLDKMMLAALEATLRIYSHGEAPEREIPTLALMTRTEEAIQACGERMLAATQGLLEDIEVTLEDCMSQLGSGALPVDRLPSRALTWRPQARDRITRERILRHLEAAFRQLSRPVIGRLSDGALRLDMRCLAGEAEERAFVAQLDELKPQFVRAMSEARS